MTLARTRSTLSSIPKPAQPYDRALLLPPQNLSTQQFEREIELSISFVYQPVSTPSLSACIFTNFQSFRSCLTQAQLSMLYFMALVFLAYRANTVIDEYSHFNRPLDQEELRSKTPDDAKKWKSKTSHTNPDHHNLMKIKQIMSTKLCTRRRVGTALHELTFATKGKWTNANYYVRLLR